MDALKRAKRRFWIAVTVTITLAMGIGATWICSAEALSRSRTSLALFMGEFSVMRDSLGTSNAKGNLLQFRFSWSTPRWNPYALYPRTVVLVNPAPRINYWFYDFPLWPILLPSAIIAFRAHRTIRRLSREVCKNCAYSRAGLAADAPCPECGRV